MILQQLQPRRLRSRETFYAPVSKTQAFKDAGLFALEKGTSGGATTLQDITKALDEYRRLFKAGIASNAEKLTLSRAFPDNSVYVEAGILVPENETMVIGGPASVELIDREGHMITNDALNNAFKKYMDNFRTRNAMVLHSDVQVGWALPAYITKGGQIFKSGVGDAGLFFICELRGDTKIAEKVAKQIEEGKLRSYSIAGSATKIQQMQKGLMPYMQVDEMELAEVTVCEKGVNQAAGFEILKAEDKNPDFPDEDEAVLIVDPEEDKPKQVSHVSVSINLLEKEDGDIDFTNTFFNYMTKIRSEKIGRSFGDESAKGKRGGHNVGEVNIRDTTEAHRKRGPEAKRFAYEEQRMARDVPQPKVDTRWGAPVKEPKRSRYGRPMGTSEKEEGVGKGKVKATVLWDAAMRGRKGEYDPYLDEPVTSKPVMTAEERKQKNIIPSIMDRSIENMAMTSPNAPKIPTKPPRKTGGGGASTESNGHYPNKKIPTNPNIVNFLNHMEKTITTGEYKPRGVGKQKRKSHPTDSD